MPPEAEKPIRVKKHNQAETVADYSKGGREYAPRPGCPRQKGREDEKA